MFDIFETIELEPIYGAAWKDCYLKFYPIGMGELEKLSSIGKGTDEEATRIMIKLLQDKFVEGTGIKNGERVQVTKEDIAIFPIDLMSIVTERFTSGVSKKKLNPITTTSEVLEVPSTPQS